MGSNSVVVKMIMHFAFLMSIFPTLSARPFMNTTFPICSGMF